MEPIKNGIERELEAKRNGRINDGKPPKSLLVWNLLFSSLMSPDVLEDVHDCMCMCGAVRLW